MLFLYFMPAVILALTGDITPLTNSSTYTDSNIQINFTLTSTNITFLIKYKAYAYFSILYGNQMSGGDYSIIQINSGAIVLIDAHASGGHNTPTQDNINNLFLLGTDTDNSSYIIVKYTRKLNTGDSQDTALNVGQSFSYCYAFRSGSKILAQHRNGQYILFGGLLDNGQVITQQKDDQSLTHGIVLTVVWCFLADIAILLKYLRSFSYNIAIHGFIFFIVILASVIEIAIIMNQNNPKLQQLQSPKDIHFVIGILILSWMFVQFIGGIVTRLVQNNTKGNPKLPNLLRFIHKYSGYALVLLCKAQIIIGWKVMDSDLAFLIIIIWIAFTSILIIIYITFQCQNIKLRKNVELTPYSKKIFKENNIQEIMKPYPICQLKDYFIFNDEVYTFSSTDFHPGGVIFIQKVNKRDVDRFIYGMYTLQQYPDLPIFVHPKNSFKMLGNPILRLPVNPMYQLEQEQYFQISSVQTINQFNRIFYFQNIRSPIKFKEMNDLWHIGQYFIVESFGVTRMYTCVVCMRKPNIQKIKTYLSVLNYNNIIQENKNSNDKIAHEMTSIIITKNFKQNEKEQLPLIIKKYENGKFTSKIFEKYSAKFKICGLKGRGLGLQYLPQGQIAIIVGGTGLFPFLDLFDIIFKFLASKQIKLKGDDEKTIFQTSKILKKYKFLILGSFGVIEDLIIPNQLLYMADKGQQYFKIFLRFSKKLDINPFEKYTINQRFTKKIIQEKINRKKLSMVYICGPPRMYQEVSEVLKKCQISSNQIYFV